MQCVPNPKVLYLDSKCKIKLSNKFLRPTEVGVHEIFKYLGFYFSFTDVQVTFIKAFSAQLRNIEKATLIPFKKFHILKTYLIFRYIYGLWNAAINRKTLQCYLQQVLTDLFVFWSKKFFICRSQFLTRFFMQRSGGVVWEYSHS